MGDHADEKTKATASEFVKTLVVFDKNEQEKHDRIKAMSSERVANAIVPVGQTTVVANHTVSSDLASSRGRYYQPLRRSNKSVGSCPIRGPFWQYKVVYALTFSHGQVNDYAVYIQNQQQGILGWSTK